METIQNKNPPIEEVYIPSFNEGDKLELIPKFKDHSSDLINIVGTILTVDYCKMKDLGDIVVEVLYLKKPSEEDTSIRNPYLAEHFKLITNETASS
jgi:hypothetical protein